MSIRRWRDKPSGENAMHGGYPTLPEAPVPPLRAHTIVPDFSFPPTSFEKVVLEKLDRILKALGEKC